MRTFLNLLLFTSLGWLCSCKNTPVDLTYGYDNTTVYFPGGKPFRWTNKRTQQSADGSWYSANDFETAEHGGTHIDAPSHFYKDGTPVDKISLDKFFVRAVLINATAETGTNASYKLPTSKLIEWERLNGEIPDHSVVLINFGWGKKYYPNKELYLGPSVKELSYPTISLEAAQWIVDTKRVVGIGIDTPSPDLNVSDVHNLLSRKDMYILENLNMSMSLPAIFRLIALPMKLVDGTGGPIRVVGFV